MLAAKGMDAAAASRAATSLLGRAVTGQSTVIAFDTAFNAVALLFVFAAPVLVAIKIGIARYAEVRAARLLETQGRAHDPQSGVEPDGRSGAIPFFAEVSERAENGPQNNDHAQREERSDDSDNNDVAVAFSVS